MFTSDDTNIDKEKKPYKRFNPYRDLETKFVNFRQAAADNLKAEQDEHARTREERDAAQRDYRSEKQSHKTTKDDMTRLDVVLTHTRNRLDEVTEERDRKQHVVNSLQLGILGVLSLFCLVIGYLGLVHHHWPHIVFW